MYVCICMYPYVWTCVYMYVHVFTCMDMYVHVCTGMYTYVHVYMYVHVCTCLQTYAHRSVYVNCIIYIYAIKYSIYNYTSQFIEKRNAYPLAIIVAMENALFANDLPLLFFHGGFSLANCQGKPTIPQDLPLRNLVKSPSTPPVFSYKFPSTAWFSISIFLDPIESMIFQGWNQWNLPMFYGFDWFNSDFSWPPRDPQGTPKGPPRDPQGTPKGPPRDPQGTPKGPPRDPQQDPAAAPAMASAARKWERSPPAAPDVPAGGRSRSPAPLDFKAITVMIIMGVIFILILEMLIWLVVGPPLWKIWKSIGMISNPIYGKIKNGNQTTNQ